MSTFRKQTQTSYLLKRCLQEPCSNLHHRPERRRQHLHDQLRRELRFRRHHLAGQHLSAPVPVPLHYCGVLQERPQHCRGEFKATMGSHHCYRLKTWTGNSWLGTLSKQTNKFISYKASLFTLGLKTTHVKTEKSSEK